MLSMRSASEIRFDDWGFAPALGVAPFWCAPDWCSLRSALLQQDAIASAALRFVEGLVGSGDQLERRLDRRRGVRSDAHADGHAQAPAVVLEDARLDVAAEPLPEYPRMLDLH